MSPDPISTGATWVHELIFTSLLPIVASIAIAFIGFRMLTGRMGPRRGMTVVIGIFLALGAPAIATGLIPGGGGSQPSETPFSELQVSAYDQPATQSQSDPVRSPYSKSSVGN